MKSTPEIYRKATIAALLYMVSWGLIISIFPLKPFWRDEWCMLYNIKFKDADQLWGKLDFTQQFPRVYLQIVKAFTSAFDYSYQSLRLQSFLVGAAALGLTWRLARRLFTDKPERYLFILVIAGNPMFIDYLGQVKHYEMEMLMGLVALWQYVEILQPAAPSNKVRKGALYLSLVAAPFFSYTYPIAIAPALLLITLAAMQKNGLLRQRRGEAMLFIAVSVVSCAAFYYFDAAEVLKDTNMHNFWFERVDYINGGIQKRSINTWKFFAKTGAGALFEVVFGIACLAATISAALRVTLKRKSLPAPTRYMLQYALLLVGALIGLYMLDKIPLGQAKFTIFAAPALSLILAHGLKHWTGTSKKRAPGIITGILFAAMAGNILTAFLQIFTSDDYRLKLKTYHANVRAIELAKKDHIPIVVTPAIGLPDDITVPVPYLSMPDAAGILKTYPDYHEKDGITIVATGKNPNKEEVMHSFPEGAKSVVLADGTNVQVISQEEEH
ncbi:MAG: glycosyltransferase family 39 protein [Taibaiella sp.]|nr:glycosyltransferase family 39 protein [Taibaiella sp.]